MDLLGNTLVVVVPAASTLAVTSVADLARIEPRVKVAWTLPASAHPPVVYPAAVVTTSTNPAEAAEFLLFCRSVDAMAVFRAAGFTPPP